MEVAQLILLIVIALSLVAIVLLLAARIAQDEWHWRTMKPAEIRMSANEINALGAKIGKMLQPVASGQARVPQPVQTPEG